MHSCQECGAAFRPRQAAAYFCCATCRKRFDNRRMKRGAELYDMFMAARFDRTETDAKGAWTDMCSYASAYRRADKAMRGGRKSWIPMSRRQWTLPHHTSDQGDRR